METITKKGNLEHQIYLHKCLSLVFNSFNLLLYAGVTLFFQAPEYTWVTNFTFSYNFK